MEQAGNRIRLDLSRVTDAAGNLGQDKAESDDYTVDTKAPEIVSARVNGQQLVLRYADGLSLDGEHRPPNGSFAVLVDGAANAVTGVVVDAKANTVTLSLSKAVAAGQRVSVGYIAPTTGNDAAGFNAMRVRNDTPDPKSQTPAADSGSDGIPDAQENQGAPIADSNGKLLAGDGNGDGVKDGEQAAVGSASFVNNAGDRSSVTLVAGSENGKVAANSSTRLSSLTQQDPPAHSPKKMEMPIDLTAFTATVSSSGGSEKFSLYLDQSLQVNGYWVQNSAGAWVNLASEPYGGKMVTEGGRLRLDFQITDGGQYDADGKADGVITASGAAVRMPLSIVGQASDTQDALWF